MSRSTAERLAPLTGAAFVVLAVIAFVGFGGSTPDPSSWDYSPNRVISGAFINFEGGEYNGLHYSSTSGAERRTTTVHTIRDPVTDQPIDAALHVITSVCQT